MRVQTTTSNTHTRPGGRPLATLCRPANTCCPRRVRAALLSRLSSAQLGLARLPFASEAFAPGGQQNGRRNGQQNGQPNGRPNEQLSRAHCPLASQCSGDKMCWRMWSPSGWSALSAFCSLLSSVCSVQCAVCTVHCVHCVYCVQCAHLFGDLWPAQMSPFRRLATGPVGSSCEQ